MLSEFNLNKKDHIYLIFITIVSCLLVGYYINFNYQFGIYCSDVYVYLLNAMYYSGTNVHSTNNIYLSPVICFLTSLFFRLGFVDKLAIYLVTGIFAVLGNIGMYILLKKFFNNILSLCGSIIYATLALNLTWLANGSLDVPAVAVTIWIILFAVISIKSNPKYYTGFIPLITIGIFTRYTLLLVLPALAIYYIFEKGFTINEQDKKYIKKGILIAVVIFAITVAILLIMSNNHIWAANQVVDGITGTQGKETDPAFNTDVTYYLSNYLNFISSSNITFIDGNPSLNNFTPLSLAVIGIILIGFVLWAVRTKPRFEKKHCIPLGLFLIAILTFTRISSVATMIFVLVGIYLIGKDSENKIPYFMISWFLVNFIFYSYYDIKVNRYIIPTFPALIYFLIAGLDEIHGKIRINENIIPIILIIIFLIQGFTFISAIEETDDYKNIESISQYLINVNPDYEDEHIGVYNIRPYSWYLGRSTIGIPTSNLTGIEQGNITYYISNKEMNLTNFTKIKQIDEIYLYERL